MNAKATTQNMRQDSRSLPAINLTGSNRLPHLFSRLLLIAFAILFLVVAFAPWRQFVRGDGRVIAFDPLERRVNVESQVSGRIRKLLVFEGQQVKAGDVIAEIQDNDPDLLERLRSQRDTAAGRVALVQTRIEALDSQITQQNLAKGQALDSARQSVSANKIASETAILDYDRVKILHEKGLTSRRDFEAAILRRDSTAAVLLSSEATLKRTENDFNAIIASTTASRQSAASDMAKAQEELASFEIRLSQNMRQTVTAPRDGMILEVPTTDGSYLKPGDLICVLIPNTEKRFVEVMVDGNDVALIQPRKVENGEVIPGSPARLVFEGWPAIQAIGWPQLAVGTYGGEVMFIDPTDDGKGKFRVVIAPNEDIVDRNDGKGPQKVPWPDGERWLRQGVQANAWVMLDEVPLWFEIWRQINGFPAIGKELKEDKPKSKK